MAFALWALGAPPVARADCAQLGPLEQTLAAAEVVFVGTVTGLENDSRTATFRVEEVWKGRLGETVVVNGGASFQELERAESQGYRLFTSVDRTFEIGARYLVVPFGTAGKVLADNACSGTQPYRSELDSFRPSAASAPTSRPERPAASIPSEPTGGAGWSVVGLAVGSVAVAGAAAWLLVRSRRTTSTR
ncbi:MAG: hypothetical protein ACRDM9_02065 [Gaiellaceae bacterium]